MSAVSWDDATRVVRYTPDEIIEEARNWLADCQWADMDVEDFEALTGQQIVIATHRHYEGGWNAFARSLD